MLTTDQMNTVAVDQILGRPPRIQGPDADELRESIAADMAEAKKNGWTLTIPNEWPDFPGDSGSDQADGEKPLNPRVAAAKAAQPQGK